MRSPRIFPTSLATPALLDEVRALLDTAFGNDFSDDDWAHTLGGWHAAVIEDGRLIAHAAVVTRTLWVDDQEFATGYVEGVATAPERQGEGLGSLVMSGANDIITATFELGALSTDRHRFYERLGWERWSGPTFVVDGAARRRTPEEDDGIMVLRFGPSEAIDLGAPIVCQARDGDDW